MEWDCMNRREVEGEVFPHLRQTPHPKAIDRMGHIGIRKFKADHMPKSIGVPINAMSALERKEEQILE